MKPATLIRGPLSILVLPLVLGCGGEPGDSKPPTAALKGAPEPTAPRRPSAPARKVPPAPVRPVPAY